MKTKLTALLCFAMSLMSLAVGALASNHSASASIDLVFDGMTFTDTVQVEWNERYPVPEGGVKWDGTEDFIGFADRESWKIIDKTRFSYVEGQIIFMAEHGDHFYEVEQIAAKYGARIVAYLALTESYVIELIENKTLDTIESVIEELKKEDVLIEETIKIHYVNYLEGNSIAVSDPWGGAVWNESKPEGLNWGVEAIRAVSAWGYSPFMNELNIAIIDSMFWDEHEDIRFERIFDADQNNDLDMPYEDFAHGTHVAGIALAIHNNERGISGVFPKGRAIAIGMHGINQGDSDRGIVSQPWINYQEAIQSAIENGAHVINHSMGYAFSKDKEPNADGIMLTEEEKKQIHIEEHENRKQEFNDYFGNFFRELIRQHKEAQMNGNDESYEFIFINSAGNENMDARYSWAAYIDDPCFVDRCLIVGSIGQDENGEYEFSDFSNWGNSVNIVAPGEKIYSTVPTDINNRNNYANDFLSQNKNRDWSGTSQAAPHVAGVAAMIWSLDPSFSGAEVRDIILENSIGTLIDDKEYKRDFEYPMLDALSCVEEAFRRASGNGTLCLTASKKDTNEYIYDVQVSIKPLKICQETETTNASTGVVYPYIKPLKLGQYEVTVSKDGYRSHTETITVTRDSTIDLNVSLIPNDAPQITKGTLNGAVTFNSVGVNGIEVDVTRGTTHVVTLITNENGQFAVDLEPGQYVLSINESGYAPVSKETVVFTGKTTTENIELKQNKGTLQGTIVFNSFGVENAKVDIKNGESVVMTVYSDANGQFIACDLPAGEYVLSINEDGYVPVERSVEVLPGEVVSEVFTLELDVPETPASSFTWRAISDTEAAITGYTGDVGRIRVPEKIEGRTITTIDDSAFQYNSIIEKVILPSNLTTIGMDSFNGCTNLVQIPLPDSLTTIGIRAFKGCSKLEETNIPKGWMTIKQWPGALPRGEIWSGTQIKRIVVPEGITKLPDLAFDNCTSLKEIVLPQTLRSVGKYAFRYCTGLKTIDIPDAVQTIGGLAFDGCTNLESINLPVSWSNVAGSISDHWDTRGNIWVGCSKLTRVDIPEGAVSIPRWAFRGCSSIRQIGIPSTVQQIGNWAFENCGNITAIVKKGSFAENWCTSNGIPYQYSENN